MKQRWGGLPSSPPRPSSLHLPRALLGPRHLPWAEALRLLGAAQPSLNPFPSPAPSPAPLPRQEPALLPGWAQVSPVLPRLPPAGLSPSPWSSSHLSAVTVTLRLGLGVPCGHISPATCGLEGVCHGSCLIRREPSGEPAPCLSPTCVCPQSHVCPQCPLQASCHALCPWGCPGRVRLRPGPPLGHQSAWVREEPWPSASSLWGLHVATPLRLAFLPGGVGAGGGGRRVRAGYSPCTRPCAPWATHGCLLSPQTSTSV